MDGGDLNVEEGLKTLDLPLFSIFAPLDPFVPIEKAKAFFDALPSSDKRILIASRELGCKRDYNHCDLAFGLEGSREIFGPIARWFESHSSREQISRAEPVIATGYQAPLRANERASILSGDSYARRATSVSSEVVAEVLVESPYVERVSEVTSVPPASADLEPLTTAEVPDVALEALPDPVKAKSSKKKAAPGKLAKSLRDAQLADSPTAVDLEPLSLVDPEVTSESAVAPFEVATTKKRAAGKKSAAKKPAVTKKPAAKKSVAKTPAVKKPAAKRPTASKAKPTKAEVSTKVAAKKPAARTLGKGLDLASASAALSALRPDAPKGKSEPANPIRVKSSGSTGPTPGKVETVETPKSVLKALSNASSALEAFKKPGGKK